MRRAGEGLYGSFSRSASSGGCTQKWIGRYIWTMREECNSLKQHVKRSQTGKTLRRVECTGFPDDFHNLFHKEKSTCHDVQPCRR